MSELSIQYVEPEALKPYKNNSRTHSVDQVEQIQRSMIEFGFTNPILVDESFEIIAGHGRLEAAQNLEHEKVPIIVLANLTDDQKSAYVIADNKLALNASWDFELLETELSRLREYEFDVSLIGFDDRELKAILGEIVKEPPPPDFPESNEKELAHECPKCGFGFDD